MADVKISQLTHIPSITDADVMLISDIETLVSYKMDLSNLASYTSTALSSGSNLDTLFAGIKTVDGSGSGLDADTVDGIQASSFLRSDANDTTSGNITINNTQPAFYFSETDTTTNARLILATGNFYIQAGAAGSGNSTSSGNIRFTGYNGTNVNDFSVRYGGTYNTIWHAGNDGSGSGLDADLWDGNQFSSYLNQALLTTSSPTFTGLNLTGSGGTLNTLHSTADGTTKEDFLGGFVTEDRAFRLLSERQGGSRYYWLTFNLEYDGTTHAQGNWGGSSAIKFAGSTTQFFADYQVTGGSQDSISPTLSMSILPTGVEIENDLSIGGDLAVFGNISVTGTVDGRDIASDGTKLDGIEPGATADQTASEILTLIKTVDGSGSGLDADTVDGLQASSFVRKDNVNNGTVTIRTDDADFIVADSTDGVTNFIWRDHNVSKLYLGTSAAVPTTRADMLTSAGDSYWHAGNDGSGSGLDADTLDGVQGSSFLRSNATDSFTGTITNSGEFHSFYNDNAPGTNLRLGRDTYQYMTFHGGSAGNYMTSVSTSGNPKYNIKFGISVDSGATLASSYTLEGSSGDIWHSGNDGSGSGLDADLLDGLNSGSFFRADTSNSVDVRLAPAQGRGLRFWDSDNYKIWMSTATDATWGGRLDSTSDYNMYFRMTGGTNRGFVFQNSSTEVFQIESDGQTRQTGPAYVDTSQRVFADNYHPNADTLTTARTISLGGDVSGSASFDGSANITINAAVSNDSHTHDGRYYTESEINTKLTNGTVNKINNQTQNQTGNFHMFVNDGGGNIGMRWNATTGGTNNLVENGIAYELEIDNDGTTGDWSIMKGSTATGTAGETISWTEAFRIEGSNSELYAYGNKIWHAGNDGSGSGLDADTLDGVQGSSFLRSNATDSFTGTITNSGEFHSFYDNNAPGTNLRLGRATSQYMTFHGGSAGNYMTSVSTSGNPKYNIKFGISVDSGATLASSYTLEGSSGDIWHSGNDGSGSGLDADTVDGLQATDFVRINSTSGNSNDYLHISRNSTNATLYVNNISTGDIARFFKGSASSSTSGTNQVTIANDGSITATGDINTTSDARVKDNIEIIENAVDKVKQIRGVTFNRTDKEDAEKRYAGVIAQEVQKVLPEVIGGDEDNLTVAYGNMIGLLIEAIKEQQKQIEELKGMIQ